MEINMDQKIQATNGHMDARGLAEFLGWSRKLVCQRVTSGAWIESEVLAWEEARKEDTRVR